MRLLEEAKKLTQENQEFSGDRNIRRQKKRYCTSKDALQ